MGNFLQNKTENLLICLRQDSNEKLKELISYYNIVPNEKFTNRNRTLIQLCSYYCAPNCLLSLIELKNDINLQKAYIEELLNEYLSDNNSDAFLSALKPLIELNGSISAFAKKTGINRTYFYKLFKKQVQPEFPTIVLIIKNLGFDINFNLKVA